MSKQTRNLILLCVLLLSAITSLLRAQGAWVQKASLPPGQERLTAVAFTLGNKGYLGTGYSPSIPATYLSDFWEYDPITDAWTQKANFGGGLRGYAVGCAINGKGYLGTGKNLSGVYNDWWEYDPFANAWIQKANYPAVSVAAAFSFSINTKGYIGTGGVTTSWNCVDDFYEYDPVTDAWTPKANFPGGVRYDVDRAVFVIGTNGYCGTGYCIGSAIYLDLWEYSSLTNAWTQKANYPGPAVFGATGFSICGIGFLGLGRAGSGPVNPTNFWKFDPASNSWSAAPSFPAQGRLDQPSFVINDKAYIGTGYEDNNSIALRDLWEFSYSGAFLSTNNTTVCQGSSATLTASGGNSYSWMPGGQTGSSIVVSPTANATYTVIGTGNCGTDTAYATVTLTTAITASVSPNTTICAGQTVALSASGGSPYLWNTGATTGSITISPTVSTTYSVIVGSSSCLDTASSTVTVAPAPAPVITGNTSLCTGDIATLTASGGSAYSWSTGATTSSITPSPATNTTYTVIATNAGGCTSSNIVNVTVSPPPVASVSGTTICTGQTATLTASGGGNYSWSNGSTTNPISVSPTSTSTYSVIVSIGSCVDVASASVIVNPSPSVSVSGNTTLCVGDIATLTASGSTNYTWSNGSSAATITVSPSATTNYTVTSSNGSCTSSTAITVLVSPPPIANANNSTICSGQNAILTASGGGTYVWSNGATTSSISITPTAAAAYSVIVSIGNCSDTASAMVTVNPSPTASAFSNIVITQGQSTTLSASGGGTYLWINGSTQNPITISPPVTTIYCVTVTQNNCSDTACVTVTVEPIDCSFADDQLFIPDAFSPNGDTKNDVLGVYYPHPSCIKEFMLIIYDRWGEKIFEADNITALWDGTYKGKLMNTAVFVYYMKVSFITGNEVIRKGNVSLIR
ncbi:MAG: T9SS type B sorting domain-containing protein [Bacteroidetes bacterium]|nr:MAG: T9SS type B sorting domain-containing protein [Bacteroidota bacterium]